MSEKKQVGKKPMTPQEKKARQELLFNENIQARTKRVLNPRIKRVLKNLDTLINAVKSPRYAFTPEQQKKVLTEFADRYQNLESAFKGTQKKEIEDIL